LTIRAVLFDANGADRDIEVGDAPVEIGAHQLLWIDLLGRDRAELDQTAAAVGLEGEGIGRLAREHRRSGILRLPERVVLTLGAVEPDDAEARRHELDIVVGVNHVITVHDEPLAALDDFRTEIDHEELVGKLDAASFTGGLIDSVFTSYFRQIEAIERDIDALDEVAIRADAGADRFLPTVVRLRRRIARLRRAIAPNRDALLPLERPDYELREDLGAIWPGTVQRLERAIDGLENARELLVGSFDLYLGRASQRTNDVMKALTLISAIALPGIVLAGVMGMNFKVPFFDEPGNFFLVLATMGLFSIVIVAIARWRHWV
jgi:Mg2+ and Co2+ transporter CorA